MSKAVGSSSHLFVHLQKGNDSIIEAMAKDEGGVVLEEGGGCVLFVDRS